MNIFMISDASYCTKTKKAGIGVIDTFSGNKYSTTLKNIKNIHESEFIALVYSVKIALNKEYDDVVFVYDCKGIDISNLELYVKYKFTSAQFLWLTRNFTSDADKLAKKALTLARSLKALKKNPKKLEKKNNSNIVKVFSSYNYKDIIKACIYSSTEMERNALTIFLKGGYNIYELPELKSNNVQLYRFIYHILPQNKRNKFYAFIIAINPLVLSNKKFRSRPSNIDLINRINLVMESVKKRKHVA